MNWEIKIISKTLMTKISHISWGGYDKGFYSNQVQNGWKVSGSRDVVIMGTVKSRWEGRKIIVKAN